MTIIDEALLAQFRLRRSCEYCRKPLNHLPHVHHLFTRGAGRLDVQFNLMALGGPWDCGCHNERHNGAIADYDLLAVVAVREGWRQDQITDAVHRLRRLPKECVVCPWCEGIGLTNWFTEWTEDCSCCGGWGAVGEEGLPPRNVRPCT